MTAADQNKIEPDHSHILVVDDDKRIRDLVCRYLRQHDFIVCPAENAAIAQHLLEAMQFDAIVLDVMMPGESGLDLTEKLRKDNQIPILLLTALGEVGDRITGLETGADDYLAKPFEPRELVLRLKSLLKRSQADNTDHNAPFRVGQWVFHPESSGLRHKDTDEPLKLTTVEENLLMALAKERGQVVSREALAGSCGVDAGERTIDVQVTRLRRKIEEDTKNPLYLQTVRGKGYILRVQDIEG